MNNKEKFFFTATTLVIMAVIFNRITAGVISSAHRLLSGQWHPPLIPVQPRRCDSYGCGHYGASRDGGRRKHAGQDYIAAYPGQPVFAPAGGTVSAGPAYGDGRYPELTLVRISSGATVVKLMYVAPTVSTGQYVNAGEQIGTVQSLQKRYPGIPNHVHMEVVLAGLHVDPAPYVNNSLTV